MYPEITLIHRFCVIFEICGITESISFTRSLNGLRAATKRDLTLS